MKKIIILLIITLSLTSFTKYSESDFSIIGKWKGEDKKEAAYLIFKKNGYAYFKYQGQTLGGKKFLINEEKATMTYEVDYSKKPIEIDFIVKTKASGEMSRLLCIAEKIEKNTIKLQFGFNGKRPTEFNDKDGVIFKKVK
ncbi:hypothetical protein C8N26_2388 [Tenacibaculum lutimaris]|uniref:DUF5640 domain-containing protein n=1 Tax=Tenacibaculum lutimaris TaxID=285258 RepID=A0A420DYV1_9FLAO|nr:MULTISPECIES: hypothetical protein [Tenacibaculum]RKF03014.1 hypothetical protein C8N26_2388 [Tenacibaculum lutimaris]